VSGFIIAVTELGICKNKKKVPMCVVVVRSASVSFIIDTQSKPFVLLPILYLGSSVPFSSC
jgi:hypothetical protein